MSNWLKIEPTRRQVAIAGNVVDAQTGAALGRARVEIAAAPDAFTGWLALQARQYGSRWAALDPRPDRVCTAADGHFHFLDLPDGDYALAASLPGSGTRYGTAQGQAAVSRDGEGNLRLARVQIALPPTALRGLITDQASGEPVVMAQVRVEGSGEQTFSDGSGQYLLVGLEAGERTVRVSARGHGPIARTVQLGRGGSVQLDIAL